MSRPTLLIAATAVLAAAIPAASQARPLHWTCQVIGFRTAPPVPAPQRRVFIAKNDVKATAAQDAEHKCQSSPDVTHGTCEAATCVHNG